VCVCMYVRVRVMSKWNISFFSSSLLFEKKIKKKKEEEEKSILIIELNKASIYFGHSQN
jgi:hypothetical protein